MTDKRLTESVGNSNRLTDDEDIMKALECLFGCVDCRKCPYSPRYKFPLCQRQVAKDTRDIITRQQAEILRLKSMNQAKLDTIHDLQAEIERLKECPRCVYEYDGETMEYCVRRKSDDKLFQFYAGTGKIMGFENKRGIHSLIRLLDDMRKEDKGKCQK